MAKALQDVVVLDFTRYLAGPYCTMLLKELGAEVIKIERPGVGDFDRGTPPLTEEGESYQFISRNRGKKSITLNLSTEKGLQIARELVKKADIVVENFSPGVMDRLGLGYKELSQVNPRLIYASVCGFGHSGPRQYERAFDIVAQAMGGLMSVTGFPDNPPTKAGPAVGDFTGSFHTTIAILAALHYRSISGEGQAIDISMQDGIWAITAPERGSYFLNNQLPPRTGNAHPDALPFGTYPAKDGHVVIVINAVEHWDIFLKIIGRDDLIGDQRYAILAERTKHRDEVEALVENWTRTKSIEEIVSTLQNANLPCCPVPAFDQVANDPQLKSREMLVEVEQAASGKVKVTGSAFKMSKTPGDNKFPAPSLGEHNYEVYTSLLGYREQDIKKLADEGVI